MKTLLKSVLEFFERSAPAFPDHPVQTPPRGLLAFCLYYARDMLLPLGLMSVTTACIAILEVSLFGFLGRLVDWLAAQNPDTFFSEHGLALLGMSIILLIVLPILIFIHAAIVHQTLLGNFPMAIRWSIHRYLLHQSISFYEDEFAGRISTKMMQTALSVREFVMKVLDIFIYVGVYFLSMVVLAVQQDWRLALPLGFWLMGYIGLQYWLLPPLRRISEMQANARADMTGKVVDSYANISTVKLFSHTSAELKYVRSSMGRFLNTVYRQMRLVTGLSVGINALNYALVFMLSLISIFLWRFDLITLGSIAIVVSMSFRLNGMAQWILWEVSHVFEHIGTVLDGMNMLTKPLSVQDIPTAQTLAVTKGAIDLKDVTFSYSPEQPLFQGLNLSIKGGEKVGLVGRSGAGKSTIVSMILRFYDIQSGNILIDNQNIDELQQDSLRSNIAVVTQDNALLHRTIRENIAYGRPNATEAQIIAAAKQAEAYSFIRDLKDVYGNTGFDVQVGERGVKLSGGQRQRIALARVLLKNAPILILDEATSALDSEVEQAIQSSLQTLMENKTVIAIAHRLSTIAALDRLIVLDEGEIIEQGTHHELLALGGVYAKLWQHQSGGFLASD